MIIYNKYHNRKSDLNTIVQAVKPKRPPLTKANIIFLKSLNLRLKNNVGNT